MSATISDLETEAFDVRYDAWGADVRPRVRYITRSCWVNDQVRVTWVRGSEELTVWLRNGAGDEGRRLTVKNIDDLVEALLVARAEVSES